MKFNNKKINKQKAFALLFSVFLSNLLLAIGLSIFNIALKELSISSAARQSIYAYYAADSGRECAMYWDKKGGQIKGLFDDTNTGIIKCGNPATNINVITYGSGPDLLSSQYATTTISTTALPIFVTNDLRGPSFSVVVSRSIQNRDGVGGTQISKTTVSSIGHDSEEGDKVERAVEETY
jgi:hypothetical protein